jgi:hypothetical protein
MRKKIYTDKNYFKKFIKRKGSSYTDNILDYFKHNAGRIVTSEELAQIPGEKGNPISHNIRRVFELRDEQGYEIINHKDNEKSGYDLKVNEWILLDKKPNPKNIRSRGVNKRIAFEVFTRDKNTCQICGRTPEDDDPFKNGHKIILHVGHIIAHKEKDGKHTYEVENLENLSSDKILTKDDFITMCNICNEGAKNTNIKKITLLDRIKSADVKEQETIYKYLEKLRKHILLF